jgi:predicted type IV restriction endonuclease
VEAYGLKEGVNWLILTNGVDWKVYRLESDGASPVKVTLAFEIDLSELNKASLQNMLLLHKQMVKRGKLEDAWNRISALAPTNIRKILQSERVLNAIPLEVKSTAGLNATVEDIRDALTALAVKA